MPKPVPFLHLVKIDKDLLYFLVPLLLLQHHQVLLIALAKDCLLKLILKEELFFKAASLLDILSNEVELVLVDACVHSQLFLRQLELFSRLLAELLLNVVIGNVLN